MKFYENIEKNSDVLNLLKKLSEEFDKEDIELAGHWNSALDAFGLINSRDKNQLIYISLNEDPKDTFFYELEHSNDQLKNEKKVYTEKAIDYTKLVQIIRKHLLSS